ncbi:hypothetical protein L1887_58493 [Cichorium endivia]|nr:hypothetical protein L1887_58493 [Cichorium endivia]
MPLLTNCVKSLRACHVNVDLPGVLKIPFATANPIADYLQGPIRDPHAQGGVGRGAAADLARREHPQQFVLALEEPPQGSEQRTLEQCRERADGEPFGVDALVQAEDADAPQCALGRQCFAVLEPELVDAVGQRCAAGISGGVSQGSGRAATRAGADSCYGVCSDSVRGFGAATTVAAA